MGFEILLPQLKWTPQEEVLQIFKILLLSF